MDTDTKQSINDDQELAKVLAGVTSEANNTAVPDTSQTTVTGQDDTTDTAADEPETAVAPVDDTPAVVVPPSVDNTDAVTPSVEPTTHSTSAPSGDSELDSVKLAALQELRPLVDKLNVSPEEKFDTYLLLLRSTDDKALIAPAHDAAKAIVDETRRAQALLDIIKEIDFLSQNQK